MLFNQLLNISIQSELVSIGAYKKSDFNDLNNSFDVAFFQYFLNDYNYLKEFETAQLNLIKDRN